MNSTELEVAENKGLSANALKYIAVVAMLIDHIAWCFVDTYSVLGQIMHIIGRMTAPIMCYFIAEGYHHTRNVKKYLLRLGIFALISWVPFTFMELGILPIGVYNGRFVFYPQQGVIYTFFLGLLALIIIHSEKLKTPVKAVLLVLIFMLSFLGDWYCLAVVWIIIFDRYHGSFNRQMIGFAASSAVMIPIMIAYFVYSEYIVTYKLSYMSVIGSFFQFGVLLAVIPLYFYNGKRGGSEKFQTFNKWFFYVFYPLHMVILGCIKFCV